MRARDQADPTSWAFQAAIHGSVTSQPHFNQCQHGSYLFLPWHRMYLYHFERILRAASADPTLALPYWDYSNTAQNGLPAVFRSPADSAANPLYTVQRDPAVNAGSGLPPSDVTFAAAFAATNFYSPDDSTRSFGGQYVSGPLDMDTRIYGQLEAQPHNTVHQQIAGLMAAHETAAQDAIFYLHHANIDRLWKRWLDQGGGRTNPTDQPDWLNASFQFFDEAGNEATITVAGILDTVTQLHYRYDDDPPAFASAAATRSPAAARTAVSRTAPLVLGVYSGAIDLGTSSTAVIDCSADAQPIFTGIATNPSTLRITLRCERIDAQATGGPTYEIYLNAPPGFAPDHQSEHYVGNLGHFGMMPPTPDMPSMPAVPPIARAFDVTACVRSLKIHGQLDSNRLTFTFVPRSAGGGPRPAHAHLQIGRLALIAA